MLPGIEQDVSSGLPGDGMFVNLPVEGCPQPLLVPLPHLFNPRENDADAFIWEIASTPSISKPTSVSPCAAEGHDKTLHLDLAAEGMGCITRK